MIYLVLMLLGFQIPLSIQLGMSEAALNQIYPGLKTTKYHSETNYHRQETIEGIAVEWVYRLENDKLNWVFCTIIQMSSTKKILNFASKWRKT